MHCSEVPWTRGAMGQLHHIPGKGSPMAGQGLSHETLPSVLGPSEASVHSCISTQA